MKNVIAVIVLGVLLVGCAKICAVLPVIAPTVPVSFCVGVTTPTPVAARE